MNKVYGLRTCKYCKGICHEDSYRNKHGIRKGYYCCKSHMMKDNSQLDFTFLSTIFERIIVKTA